MGKYTKIILLTAGVILFIAVYSVFKSGGNKINIDVKKNEIRINNFEMSKVVDEDNNFYKINAAAAKINRKSRVAELSDFTIVYKKGETDFTASAAEGFLEEEVRIDVKGKITGKLNELDFETGEKGKFHYDFDTETGTITGNIVVNNGNGNILSDKAVIYQKENRLEFDGNVRVTYYN
jgi:hypothetical protein